jgi:hypothetical protein
MFSQKRDCRRDKTEAHSRTFFMPPIDLFDPAA